METLPEVGTVFEWPIEDIFKHQSTDMSACIGDLHNCKTHGIASVYDCEDGCESTDLTTSEKWEALLDMKRQDDWYDDVVEVIKTEGFTKQLTAWVDRYTNQLTFGDGHHRLAAAMELGLTAVPVRMCARFTVEEDSGSWHNEYDE